MLQCPYKRKAYHLTKRKSHVKEIEKEDLYTMGFEIAGREIEPRNSALKYKKKTLTPIFLKTPEEKA
jgi:hypothetical protein